jgi:chloramphenicol-sensitive protein RarD
VNKWIAIALAAAGVAWMVVELGETPWLAIGLACTWGAYGLMRKRSKLGAASGLALETLLTAPLALQQTKVDTQQKGNRKQYRLCAHTSKE